MTEISRRAFLKLAAGGGGAAMATGLGVKSVDQLISYVKPDAQARPGVFTLYATTCRECPAGCGLILRHIDGRIVKVEGLPDHPLSRGGLCPRGQSAPQGQYDPDRLRSVIRQHRAANITANPAAAHAAANPAAAGSAAQSESSPHATHASSPGFWHSLHPKPVRDPLAVTLEERQSAARLSQAEWSAAFVAIAAALQTSKSAGGRVAIISDLQTGSLAELMKSFLAAFGSDRLLLYEPFNYESQRAAHQALFGRAVMPDYRLEQCDFVISFAADFLEAWTSPVGLANQFGRLHSYSDGRIGRFAYVGPRLSMTAANADEFLMVPPGSERWVALAMLMTMIEQDWVRGDLGAGGGINAAGGAGAAGGADGAKAAVAAMMARARPAPGVTADQIARLAKAFAQANSSVALAGPACAAGPEAVGLAAAAGLLNQAAGRIGQTVDFNRPHALSDSATNQQARMFLEDLGPHDVVIVHQANPAYTRPEAAAHLRRAALVVYLGTMPDETAELADWILPLDAPLESWGDYEPVPDVHGLVQPGMGRMYDTRPAGDILLALARAAGQPLRRPGGGPVVETFEDWLRLRWESLRGEAAGVGLPAAIPAEDWWQQAARRGGLWPTNEPRVEQGPGAGQGRGLSVSAANQPKLLAGAIEVLSQSPTGHAIATASAASAAAEAAEAVTADLWLWTSIMLFDGRGTNRGWLQEAPDPVTGIAWGSWIDLHPALARRLGLGQGDVIELSSGEARLAAPARITEDIADGTVALCFGQGHSALGHTAAGVGANAFRLLNAAPSGPPEAFFGQVAVRKTGPREVFANPVSTQEQFNRDIVQWVPLSTVRRMKPGDGDRLRLPLPEGYDPGRDLYPRHEYKEHRWAMAVDMQRCIGCGACAVACYAENNLVVVGRDQVIRGREMPWLRIMPYRQDEAPDHGAAADGVPSHSPTPGPRRLGWLPIMCQQCDAAPCEPVCPVFASVHNDEGLNAQVFNRCIGTRYCSNNCPYKVRRFNWSGVVWPESLKWQLNPEVSVRCRGVMEKCTFCIQRIRQAQHQAKRENRPLRDGDIQPACAQSCPTDVFVFGDLLDPQSRVSQLTRNDPRRYHVLEHLNTKPAVTYLRRVWQDEWT